MENKTKTLRGLAVGARVLLGVEQVLPDGQGGQRVVVVPVEAEIGEVSPSGEYVKVISKPVTGEEVKQWVPVDEASVIEEL